MVASFVAAAPMAHISLVLLVPQPSATATSIRCVAVVITAPAPDAGGEAEALPSVKTMVAPTGAALMMAKEADQRHGLAYAYATPKHCRKHSR